MMRIYDNEEIEEIIDNLAHAAGITTGKPQRLVKKAIAMLEGKKRDI